jgi:ribosomal protein L11 methyltransferase
VALVCWQLLQKKLGAHSVTAIDIDKWAYENTLDNVKVNKCSHIQVAMGDAGLLNEMQFEAILANINLNVLTADLPIYSKCLSPKGVLIMSGFYVDDIPVLEAVAKPLGFVEIGRAERDKWALLAYQIE